MPDASAILPGLAVAFLALVLLWFAFGTQANVRKADRVMKWLQAGLPVLGPRTRLRWLGSSVAELSIVEPRPPCRGATVLIVLEPRDLAAMWAFARSRGRRDFLLLRLDLVRAPRFRADLIDGRAWTAGDRRRDDAPFEHELTFTDEAGAEVELRHDDGTDVGPLRRFWDRLDRLSGGAWRVSVRPLVPHVEVHLLLPSLDSNDSRQLLTAVRELAEAVGAHR